MFKRISAAALTGVALTLGGCLGGTYNPGIEPVHQPVVERIDYTLDLQAGPGGLASGETGRVAEWFETIDLDYGDRVAIDDPSGYAGRAARDDVAGQAARYGLLLDDGAPVTAGPVPEGALRVVVSRLAASVPECPDWSRPASPDYQGSTMSNYGCASAVNLAVMIANPEDLISGREGAGRDTAAGSRAIKTYREKAPTGAGDLKKEATSRGD